MNRSYYYSHLKLSSLVYILIIIFIILSSYTLTSFPSSFTPTRTTSYRSHLDSLSPLLHSPTLTFSTIYVLSLPSRTDRRTLMLKWADALNINLIFIDAIHKDEPFLLWIAERVAETRRVKAEAIVRFISRRYILILLLICLILILFELPFQSNHERIPIESIGGYGVESIWLSRSLPYPLPPLPTFYPTGSWIDHLAASAHNLSSLIPSTPNVNVTELLHDPLELHPGRQLNAGVLSTYYGHLKVMQTLLTRGDASALILEDDIDSGFNLERMWSRIERVLPRAWDIVFLGHCWGRELLRACQIPLSIRLSSYGTVLTLNNGLYRASVSSSPFTSLDRTPLSSRLRPFPSRRSEILDVLQDPWIAYQTAIDNHIASLTYTATHAIISPSSSSASSSSSSLPASPLARDDAPYTKLHTPLIAFSIDPPLIIQSKTLSSDLQTGSGSTWHGVLTDSVLDRIHAETKGRVGLEMDLQEEGELDEEGGLDPARRFRYCRPPLPRRGRMRVGM